MAKTTIRKKTQELEFVPRAKDDDEHFAGALYMQEDKTYNLELPNGDCIVLAWYENDKTSQTLQVTSVQAWSEKTTLEVQTDQGNKTFKANGKHEGFVHEGPCGKPGCQLCAFMSALANRAIPKLAKAQA